MSDTDAPDMRGRRTLVINGKSVDGRSSEAIRYKAVCADLIGDLGGEPSAAQWALVQRAAGLSVQCEAIEIMIANGEPIDPADYVKLVSVLTRVLTALGIKRGIPGDDAKVIDGHTRAMMQGVE